MSTNRRLRALLDGASVTSWSDAAVVLRPGPGGAGLMRSAIKDVEEVFTRAAGRPLTVSIEAQSGPPVESQAGTPLASRPAAPVGDVRQHPLVKRAEELFGGRVVRVDPRRPAGES